MENTVNSKERAFKSTEGNQTYPEYSARDRQNKKADTSKRNS